VCGKPIERSGKKHQAQGAWKHKPVG